MLHKLSSPLKIGTLPRDIFQLFRYLSKTRKRQLVTLICLMAISAFFEVMNLVSVVPFLSSLNNPQSVFEDFRFQPFIEQFKIASTSQLILSSAIFFIVITIVNNLLRITVLFVQTKLSAQISIDIGCLAYNRILLQPYEFHILQKSSDLITLISTDKAAISNGVMNPILLMFSNGLVAIGLLTGLFVINPAPMLVAFLSLGTTYLIVYRWRRNALLRNSQMIVKHNQQQIKVVQESLSGIQNVILGGTYDFFLSTYARSNSIVQEANASNLLTTPSMNISVSPFPPFRRARCSTTTLWGGRKREI